jgi:hypothetical protein
MFKKTALSLALLACSAVASASTFDLGTGLTNGVFSINSSNSGLNDSGYTSDFGVLTSTDSSLTVTLTLAAGSQVSIDILGDAYWATDANTSTNISTDITAGPDALSQNIVAGFVAKDANEYEWNLYNFNLNANQTFTFTVTPEIALAAGQQWGWSINATSNPDNAPPVPVPAAVWLLGTGLAGLISYGRRQNLAV